ncbi:peptide/nickel transport system ATP-binding protein [Quadrisphaera granulorum]|uniref:Peptide/nickel transport system ATP-binding protein n=1 Tax=Quadrisphaera granulorum TaxID=317664 RepID=A0A316AGU3_9ACTN|nr:ABC transporter ATP-binding protein [Quadrisphaera granulorum]PWJ56160.1 peptide/nickel transport system ATP-binding protein [Quadrisphaera granulorum]SZE94794.1 peptide/nickel transport system ATP-binding protein [Quadrisphaera granulorum]
MSAATPAPGAPAAEAPVLQVENLTVAFPTEDGVVRAVRGMNYAVAPREVLGIVGESGSGKSVSSMAVMGLLPRSAQITGRILFRGEDVLSMSPRQQRGLRGRRVSMIFQDPMTAMNPVYTVGDQLAEAVRSHSAVPQKVALKRAKDMLDLVGIPQAEARLRAYPHEFSGGMRQRAMIAMAIINDPDVIIADEPTTALDVTVQAQVLDTLMSVKDAVDAAIVFITHDLGVIAQVADRVLVMYAGKPVEIGTTTEVFSKPLMPYTAGLLGSTPSAEGTRAGERLRPISGAPPSLISLPQGCPFGPRCPLVRDDCRASEPELRHRGATGAALAGVAAGAPLPVVSPNHLAACHHSDELLAAADATRFFRAESEVTS